MRKAISPLEKQLRQFVACMDALADRLRPVRRPQDAGEPECSPPELRALAAIGQRNTLAMSDLAAILNVPLSTATHTIDKLVAKDLVERKQVKHDRRIVQVAFSRKGRRIHRFVVASRLAAGRALLETLKPQERKAFLHHMKKIASINEA